VKHHLLVFSPRSGRAAAVALLVLIVLLAPVLHAPALEAHSLEIAGGFQSSFDSDHRSVYGTTGAVSVGYAAPLWPQRSWLMFEVSYLWASGESLQYDPTFDRPDAEYWVVPFVLGVRANVVPERIQGPISFYLGLGGVSALTGFKDHLGKTYRAPTWGAMVELRPEVAVSEVFSLWARQRFTLLAEVDYDSGARNLNYSGSVFQMGLSVNFK
jgi:hypothetical protein